MKYIPMNILEYRFDEKGVTEQIIVAFQLYDGSSQIIARMPLTQEKVHEVNPDLELDHINKAQADMIARKLLRDWTLVEPEIEEQEDKATE